MKNRDLLCHIGNNIRSFILESPELDYELSGHAVNVVFASSQIVEDDGSVKLYYGAADRYQCVADTTVDLLLEAALER